jgi:hypothetical protein
VVAAKAMPTPLKTRQVAKVNTSIMILSLDLLTIHSSLDFIF